MAEMTSQGVVRAPLAGAVDILLLIRSLQSVKEAEELSVCPR